MFRNLCTENGKRNRCRFISSLTVSTDHQNLLKEFFTSFQYLYSKTVKELTDEKSSFGFEFLQMIERSCKAYDRYNHRVTN